MTTPRWIRWIVSAASASDRTEDLLGDLEEVHRERLRDHGRLRATLATAAEGLGLAFDLTRERLVDAARTAIPTGSEARLAVRRLARSPFVVLTVAVSLTVGIAVATAGFTVVHAVADVGLPFEGGDRVVRVGLRDAATGSARAPNRDVLRMLDGLSSLVDVAPVRSRELNARVPGGDLELLAAAEIPPGTFRYAMPSALLGRGISALREGTDEADAVVISEGLWARAFGSAPDVLGRSFEVNGRSRRIVGVLPERTGFPAVADLWLPLAGDAPLGGTAELYARIAEGRSIEAVRSELDALAGRLPEALGIAPVDLEARVPGPSPAERDRGVLVVTLLVAFLLGIAGNVGTLMVARVSARTDELAVRAALGARRGRLIAQLSAEAFLLVVVASVAGLYLADRALAWFRAGNADQFPPWVDLAPGVWSLVFVVGTAALLTLVSGVLPALRATRAGSGEIRRVGYGRSTGAVFGRVHDLLLVGQIAVAVGVLGGASLLHDAWSSAFDMDLLPVADRTTTAFVTLPGDVRDEAALLDLRRRLTAAVEAAFPDAVVAAADYLPGIDGPRGTLEVQGVGEPVHALVARVDPEFHELLDARPLAGSLPAPGEGGVAVDLPFVEKHLAGGGAVGARIRLAPTRGSDPEWHEIVAVVPDLGLSGLDPEGAGGAYLPLGGARSARLLVRDVGPPDDVGRRLADIAYAVDPGITIDRVRTLAGVARGVRGVFRGIGAALAGLGALLLLQTLMGIYAILSFEVERRRREIGIRVALGAGGRDVVTPFVLRALLYVLIGSGVGWLLGTRVVDLFAAMTRFGIPDPGHGVFVALGALVLATAWAASLVPTRRALRVEPIEVLSAE